MRGLAVFLLGAVVGLPFAAAGCHHTGTPAPAVADPPPDGVDAGAEDEGGVAVADHVHVSGLVANDLGEAVAGRAVVLVDAEGARRATVTAGDGSFGVDAVALPYDVAVAGSPPAAFLGVERLEATFEVGEPGGPAVMPPSQTVRIGVRAPGCPALRPVCSVTVVTASVGGDGFARAPCAARTQDAAPVGGSPPAALPPTIVNVIHAWRTLPPAGASVAVHALVRCDAAAGGGGQGSVDEPPRAGDGGGSLADGAFAYGRVDGVPAAPGSLRDAGMMDAAVIASTAPVTFGARGDTDELAPWVWTTAVRLDLGGARGGAGEGEPGYVFATAEDPATTLRLPNVRGAAVRVEVRAEHPRNDPSGGFFRSAEAWSGAMPVITSTPAALLGVDLVAGPDILAPETGTPLPPDADFSWQGGGAALATLAVADSSRSIQCFRVSTDNEDIANGRLEALGLPPLDPGPHLIALTTYPKSSVADATSPDPAVRRRRFDRTQRGAATYLRAPFDVAP
jgi:hypothetical protein